ncbi:hypothetical protein GCM10010468_71700 [Actinocorallia longicatena]|uniref:Uncharacterized protein n=1 Tax=Actinocorallia longicatena TaxID=111803 RepID=A0ABP6QLI4_9ACTN
MPTFETLARFDRDFAKLTPEQRTRFRKVLTESFVPDLASDGPFRPGLRVKGVQAAPGVFEMTWAPDGRATFQYGDEVRAGETHIIWRRIGTHDIFDPPPGP